jgi:hypothetical protein
MYANTKNYVQFSMQYSLKESKGKFEKLYQ